jgi:hypothetical protein
MLTLGSIHLGFSTQVYWPSFGLEWEPKTVSDRARRYPHGFCFRAGTTIRVKFGRADQHYVLAAKVLGFGIGLQYRGKE